MINEKLEKYLHKKNNSHDLSKIQIYNKKINLYMIGGNNDVKILSTKLSISEDDVKLAISDIELLSKLIIEYQKKPIIDRSFPKEWVTYFTYENSRFASTENSLPTQRTINASKILNSRGQSLLYISGRFGSIEALKLILKIPNIDANMLNTDGSTSAIGISFDRNINLFDSVEKIKLLKDNKANLSIKKGAESVESNMCDKVKNELGLQVITGY
jgi:hypothetical protein